MKFLESTEGNVSRQSQTLTGYVKYNPVLAVNVLKNKMWQNTRHCVNIVGVVLNNTARGVATSASCNAARSSPAQPGYVSEDKILQIRQHKNDFTQQYPSVTLILNKTMTDESKAALEKWKQERIAEMGEEEFNKYYEGMCDPISYIYSVYLICYGQLSTEPLKAVVIPSMCSSGDLSFKC